MWRSVFAVACVFACAIACSDNSNSQSFQQNGAPDSGIDETVVADSGGSDPNTAPDGNDLDIGRRRRDAGMRDSGARDAGSPDTGAQDSGAQDTGAQDSGAQDSGTADTGTVDTGTPDTGALDTGTADSGTSDAGSSDDGTPTRQQCTGNFGSALTAQFGRMDGFLVSVIPPGGPRTCNGDANHVHFQILIQGSVYDVAVNVNTLQATRDMALPSGAWSEGWHTPEALDYVQLGLHNTDFSTPSDPAGAIEAFVQNANHVSIFATGYGATGAHDVHRHPSTGDGMIVIDPLSPTAHAMMFCFNTDTF